MKAVDKKNTQKKTQNVLISLNIFMFQVLTLQICSQKKKNTAA